MEFFSQESWSEYPFPSSGDLTNPGIEHRFPSFQEDSLLSKPPRKLLILLYVSTSVTRLGISYKVNCIVFIFF